jgi:hypothetical protein
MCRTVRSNWKSENGNFTLDVMVLANTTATVYVPAKNGSGVTEFGSRRTKPRASKPPETKTDWRSTTWNRAPTPLRLLCKVKSVCLERLKQRI